MFSPLRVAIIDDQRPRGWKGYELLGGAYHLARHIERASRNDRIGIMLPTSGMFPLALIATWILGRTAVPLNYLLKREELEYVIRDAGLDAVVTVTPMLEMFGEMPEGVKELRLDKLKDEFRGLPPVRRSVRRPDDFVAVLLYTSGTSGKPKGVMLTAANLSANIEQCVEWAAFTRRDVVLGVLPQFHSFGLTVLTLLPLTVGCLAIYTARFAPKKILDLMQEHRPTAFIGIPSMHNALLHAKSAAREHFTSLRYIVSGGEPLPEAVFDGFREKFGITINEGYGLTETGPVTNWCRPQEHKRRSVGRPLPGVEEIIVAEDGKVAARATSAGCRLSAVGSQREGAGAAESGEPKDESADGEVRIKGPNVMKGYYNLPQETAEAFDENGYFRTGDMGRFDADGHLYITGRYKEMLIIGGENVFPREIEEVLNAHPSVHASAVIGIHDPSRGEVPIAFIELTEGAAFSETELRTFCRQRMAQFKVPRDIRVLKELPRNPTGKIMRRELSADTPSIADAP
jgi:long-chain acyl-CoA synthetase